MVIFGFRGRLAKSEQIHWNCTHCGNSNQILSVYRNYFHIFWIPMFPTTVKKWMSCTHCKKTTEPKELPQHVKNLPIQVPLSPILFLGPLLFIAFFMLGGIGAYFDSKNTQAMIQSPAPQDYLLVRSPDNKYQIFKVVSFENGNVTVTTGNYVYDRGSEARKDLRSGAIKQEGYFSDQVMIYDMEGYKSLPIEHIVRE